MAYFGGRRAGDNSLYVCDFTGLGCRSKYLLHTSGNYSHSSTHWYFQLLLLGSRLKSTRTTLWKWADGGVVLCSALQARDVGRSARMRLPKHDISSNVLDQARMVRLCPAACVCLFRGASASMAIYAYNYWQQIKSDDVTKTSMVDQHAHVHKEKRTTINGNKQDVTKITIYKAL